MPQNQEMMPGDVVFVESEHVRTVAQTGGMVERLGESSEAHRSADPVDALIVAGIKSKL